MFSCSLGGRNQGGAEVLRPSPQGSRHRSRHPGTVIVCDDGLHIRSSHQTRHLSMPAEKAVGHIGKGDQRHASVHPTSSDCTTPQQGDDHSHGRDAIRETVARKLHIGRPREGCACSPSVPAGAVVCYYGILSSSSGNRSHDLGLVQRRARSICCSQQMYDHRLCGA